jgi:hypothetical protein
MGGTDVPDAPRQMFGCNSRFVRVGDQAPVRIELAAPNEPGPAAEDLVLTRSGGLFVVNFSVRDIDATRAHLEAVGVALESADSSRVVAVSPATAGVRFGFVAAV